MSASPDVPRTFLPRALSTRAGFATLALVNVCALWFIIPSGGLVRLTKSGLGCPDWPLCNGGVIPETSYHSVIEYSNRVASAVIMVTAVVTWLASRGLAGRPRHVQRAAFTAMAASVAQVPLGGVTVMLDLHPLMVGAHFMLSIVALTGAVVALLGARDLRDLRRRAADMRRGPLAWLSLAVLLVVIVSGVLVTAAGPHSGDPEVLTRFGHLEEAAWVHVRTVFGLLVLMVTLAVWQWREPSRDRLAAPLTMAFLPVFIVQIALGEIQYRTGLPWQIIAVHVSVAGLVWALGVALAWVLARPAVPLDPAGPRAPDEVREATEHAGVR